MTVSFLVAFDSTMPERLRAWVWCSRRLSLLFPDAEVVVCGDRGEHPGLFCKPQAVNEAARRATGDVFVQLDADVAFDEQPMRDAIRAAERGEWGYAQTFLKLGPDDTAALLAEPADVGLYARPCSPEWSGHGVSWGGAAIMPRRAWERAGGEDERYIGWGGDDTALAATVDALYGPCRRFSTLTLYHLWHPTDLAQDGWHDYSERLRDLTWAYEEAWGDRAAILSVLRGKP